MSCARIGCVGIRCVRIRCASILVGLRVGSVLLDGFDITFHVIYGFLGGLDSV